MFENGLLPDQPDIPGAPVMPDKTVEKAPPEPASEEVFQSLARLGDELNGLKETGADAKRIQVLQSRIDTGMMALAGKGYGPAREIVDGKYWALQKAVTVAGNNPMAKVEAQLKLIEFQVTALEQGYQLPDQGDRSLREQELESGRTRPSAFGGDRSALRMRG